MPTWVHRTEVYLLISVSSTNLPESEANYIQDPDLSAVSGEPIKYWKVNGNLVELQSAGEQIITDSTIDSDRVDSNRVTNILEPDSLQHEGMRVRALIQLLNKRDNYLVNRIIQLQDTLLAMKATTGAAQPMRDAVPSSFLASQVRPRDDAIQDYRDDINAGVND